MTSLERSSGALKRDHLSFLDVVAQAVGTIAPSGTPAFVILGVFATADNGTWLAYLFATLALLVLSFTITAFSSRSASPGALYAFAGQGLGPFWGTVAGWSLVIAYLFTAGAVVAGAVSYALEVLHLAFGPFDNHLPAVLLSALAIGLALAIAWRSIRLSTRLSLTLEAITVGAVLIVLGVALWQGAAGLLSLPLIGLVYPVPPAPFNLLPYAFLGLLGLGVVHFLWLRWSNPQVLRLIEDDLEAATQAVPAE